MPFRKFPLYNKYIEFYKNVKNRKKFFKIRDRKESKMSKINILFGFLNIEYLKRAIFLSSQSANSDGNLTGGPFGAVIVKDGRIIAEARNQVLIDNDPTAHAEVTAIRAACKAINSFDLTGADLYTSCEPCPMCLMAAKWANIRNIYYAATRKDAAKIGFQDANLYKMLKRGEYAIAVPELRREAVKAMKIWKMKYGDSANY